MMSPSTRAPNASPRSTQPPPKSIRPCVRPRPATQTSFPERLVRAVACPHRVTLTQHRVQKSYRYSGNRRDHPPMLPPADMSPHPPNESQKILRRFPCSAPAHVSIDQQATTAASHRDSDAPLLPSREAAPAFGTRPPASARRPINSCPLMTSSQPDSTTIAEPCTEGAAGLGTGVSTCTTCDSSASVSWSRTHTRR